MSQTNVPDTDHVVRYVGWSNVAKDADENVTGILGEAFRRRPNEEGLSVNWLERAAAADKLKKTVELLTVGLKVGKKARVAIANVAVFKNVCARRSAKVRIVHIPINGNEPHSEVRQLPREEDELLELLAVEAVTSHHRCLDVI